MYLVEGPRVKLIGCELGFLWTYGLYEFCCVVIVWSVFVNIEGVGIGCGLMCIVL